MKKSILLLLLLAALPFVSCDDDGPYEDYLVARPILEDAISFKAEAIDIIDPIPIQTSGKIYAYKNYIFINDVGSGFHVIDNQNPVNPQNIAFIKLEGNNDISIKDDKLFADSYGDLVIFDISDINNIQLTSRMVNAIYKNYDVWVQNIEFPQADIYDYGTIDYDRYVVVGWEVKMERRPVSEYEEQFRCDNCEFGNFDNVINTAESNVGQGGSLARFKIVGDYLYVVDYSDLNIFDISNLETPIALDDVSVAWDIETIFNQGEILFIGGRQGMYIYDIKDPAKPEFVSEFRHGTACDPVVVDGNFAYVTLKGGDFCGNTESGLYVVDISDLKNPDLKVIYPMFGPNGLGIKGDKLFICDGSDGLKVFDKSNAPNITQLNHFPDIEAYDVIPLENTLLMIGGGTLRQYEYLENDIQLISTFEL
jgi:hypothetical protein